VLDRDLFATPPDSLTAVRAATTIVGGRIVFERR
jgi:predicted amidohydrolase YtcJ